MRVLSLGLLLAIGALPTFAAGEHSGRRAPGFALPDLNLNYHDLADFRGRVVVLEIMQTGCPHCVAVSKNLQALKDKHGGKIVVLGIVNPPDNQSTVRKFLTDNKISTTLLFDCGQVSAAYIQVTPSNPTVHIPHVFLIDAQGTIRNDFAYTEETKTLLEGDGLITEVEKLMKAPSAAPRAH